MNSEAGKILFSGLDELFERANFVWLRDGNCEQAAQIFRQMTRILVERRVEISSVALISNAEEKLLTAGEFFISYGYWSDAVLVFASLMETGYSDNRALSLCRVAIKAVFSGSDIVETAEWLEGHSELIMLRGSVSTRAWLARWLVASRRWLEAYNLAGEILPSLEEEMQRNKSSVNCSNLAAAYTALAYSAWYLNSPVQARTNLRKALYLWENWWTEEKGILLGDVCRLTVLLEDWDSLPILVYLEENTEDFPKQLSLLLVLARMLIWSDGCTVTENFSYVVESIKEFSDYCPEVSQKLLRYLYEKIRLVDLESEESDSDPAVEGDYSLMLSRLERQLKYDKEDNLLINLLAGLRCYPDNDILLKTAWVWGCQGENDTCRLQERRASPGKKEGDKRQTQSGAPVTKVVRFMALGGGNRIGASCYLLQSGNLNLLIDAGISLQGSKGYPDWSLLNQVGIDWTDIDALLLTHCHLDHSGALPILHKLYPEIPVYATFATKDLLAVLYKDLPSEDTGIDKGDVARALQHIGNRCVNFGEEVIIKDKAQVTFCRSGHVLGAASLYIQTGDANIFVTGDYSLSDQLTVAGLELPPGPVDILISESTYGYHDKNIALPVRLQTDLLWQKIYHTVETGGSVLVPVFAVGRGQEIQAVINDACGGILPFPVYVDGRVIEINDIYLKYCTGTADINSEAPHFFYGRGIIPAPLIYNSSDCNTSERRQEFIRSEVSKGGACVITSSGMLHNYSCSAYYAAELLEGEKNAVLTTGYLDEDSPGGGLLRKGEKQMELVGRMLEVRCRLEQFHISAHAPREEILQLALLLTPRYVVLVHGDMSSSHGRKLWQGYNKPYPNIREILERLPLYCVEGNDGVIIEMKL